MGSQTIAIIGGGNMGASLLGGLIHRGHAPDSLWITDPEAAKLDHLKTRYGVHTTADNIAAAQHADVLLFAVKPQLFAEVAAPLKSIVQQQKPLVISIAAGIRSTSITSWLGENTAIVRCMPNTPALLGLGASGLYANANVSSGQRNLANIILSAAGITVWVEDEKLIDSITALSGSGPAYFFLVIEAMQAAGEKLGLSARDANALAIQTAVGAAHMAKESQFPIAELRKQVTSSQGTTEKAISVLENNNIRGIFEEAMKAACTRSVELANILGGDSTCQS